ncbi:E3 ubiquitin-protein ligase Bre1 [Portunus trituberculatus]|uniref:E3 ubiquitin protein ligase n=1 Tax=Portunus trituberculatus TaxID=210409 RepID=A0A5B7GQF2_PORTR|nr:E3 ubiquitin-protein ligase Bre1 [Portunus trituberculatus]
MDTEKAEMQNRIEDMEYDLSRTRSRCEKVESHLAETCQKLKAIQDESGTTQPGAKTGDMAPGKITTAISSKKMDELNSELEEMRELSAKRLDELEKKTNEHKEALKEVERLKMDLRQLPESVIVETTEYKCLQSQFSVLYNDSMQLKTQLEETRHQLQTSKNTHLRQIEQMEVSVAKLHLHLRKPKSSPCDVDLHALGRKAVSWHSFLQCWTVWLNSLPSFRTNTSQNFVGGLGIDRVRSNDRGGAVGSRTCNLSRTRDVPMHQNRRYRPIFWVPVSVSAYFMPILPIPKRNLLLSDIFDIRY